MTAAPFIKSLGGKTELLPELIKRMPSRFENYYEPFLGGGALFFALSPKRAVLTDANADLMKTYRSVVDDVERVFMLLDDHRERHCKTYYYDARDLWNSQARRDDPDWTAAMFIYLNRTCFNGLWRVNRSGAFNVPIGRYKTPSIPDRRELLEASSMLSGCWLEWRDFRDAMKSPQAGDFVYCDPPYDGTFTAYTAGGFTDADQADLAFTARTLAARGVRIMLSNGDTPRIRALYAGMQIDVVKCARSVNSDGKGRGKVSEVIITAGYERPAIKAPKRAKGK